MRKDAQSSLECCCLRQQKDARTIISNHEVKDFKLEHVALRIVREHRLAFCGRVKTSALSFDKYVEHLEASSEYQAAAKTYIDFQENDCGSDMQEWLCSKIHGRNERPPRKWTDHIDEALAL